MMCSSTVRLLMPALVIVVSVSLSWEVVPALCKTYTVGDSAGWGFGGDYSTWATDKTFKVGDSLVFNYQGGGHTVDEVSESDYKSCAAANSISSDSSGATTVQLKTAGKHYFICSSTGHCGQGMKLEVNVVGDSDSSSSSPSATTPSSPAASGATPAPPSTTTPSKKPPSASSSSAVAASLPLLLAAMNLVI